MFWSGIVILVFTLLAWVIQLSIPQFKEFTVVPRGIAPLAVITGTIYSPSTESKDYEAAQKSLGVHGNDNEENTWSNDEIDKMLPIYLRLDAILNQVGTQ